MKQLALVYQATEPPITHTATRKTTRHKLSALGKQRVSALILLSISIVVPILTSDLTASIFLFPLALGLFLSKKVHMN